MEKVCDDHTPVIITRKAAKPVVMMSLADYQALEETAYLLKSPNLFAYRPWFLSFGEKGRTSLSSLSPRASNATSIS